MKYLLDTRVFLWALGAPNKLNRRARELLSNEREGLFLSAAISNPTPIGEALTSCLERLPVLIWFKRKTA
jgi:hypothetical protein